MPTLSGLLSKPPGYLVSSVLISIAGIINGFDTGSIGAITEMKSFLSTIGDLTPLMRGFTVSLIMLTGAIPSFVAGQLADRFGRLAVVFTGALIFVTGSVMQAAANNLNIFIAGRAIAGLGQGVWLSTVVVYIAEIAPSLRRGALVSGPQFGAAVGVCLGYFTCFGTIRLASSMSWRIPFIIQAVQATLLAMFCVFLPTSPRWLVLHGKREKALKEIERLNISTVEAEKDILNAQLEQTNRTSTVEGFLMMFRRDYRARTLLAVFILGMVQLAGIDGVLYYAPTLFAQAGIPSQTASFLASGVSAILMLAISIPAVLYSDRMGRRTSAIAGGIVLSSCMLIIGTLYAAKSVHSTGPARWVVVLLIFVFALTYCFTWGIVSRIYASEIQPAKTRAAGNCLAQGLSFFTNWLVAFSTPIFLSKSAYGAYFLFGFLTLGTVVVLSAYMPETKGQSLEDIQAAFQQRPVMKSWMHHLKTLFSRTGIERSTSMQGSLDLPTLNGSIHHLESGSGTTITASSFQA